MSALIYVHVCHLMLLPPLDSRDQALRAVGESGLTFERTPTETWLQQRRENRAEAEAGRDGSGEI